MGWFSRDKKKNITTEEEGELSSLSFVFRPLYAQSLDKEHLPYASTLNEAVRDERIKNIALTGSYGTGKSSVLDAFENSNKGRVVRVSFSSLGAKIEDKIIDSDDTSDSETGTIHNLTNLIQKEIVKQILFKEVPRNLPRSKFRRISKIHMRPLLFPALFFAAIAVLVLFATHLLDLLPILVDDNILIYALLLLSIFSVVTIAFMVLSAIVGSSLKLEKISGGPLTLGLTGNNSYFDEYLDEILYFFESTKYDIVLIEDVDRFKKLYIFESLRQLSAIINNSSQVGKPVRFIYALKDSIFADGTDVLKNNTEAVDISGHAVIPLPSNLDQTANRTKFFDLIVPIVPFLAHTTSRNHIVDELKERGLSVAPAVVKIVAPELTDMRLIKNICNECVIFTKKILDESSIDSLKPENMFALVVYKNLFLGDFERIKSGKSILNEVLRRSRIFVQLKVIDLTVQQEGLEGERSSAEGLAGRSRNYGDKLTSFLNNVASGMNAGIEAYEYDSRAIDKDYLTQLDFWKEIAEASGDVAIVLSLRDVSTRMVLNYKLTKSVIESTVVGTTIDIDEWKVQDVAKLSRKINEVGRELSRVQTMDIAKLMNNFRDSFGNEVREIVKNEMVVALLESGYIDQYFALYTSTYHPGRLSGNAMNFMIHNVDTQTMDMLYAFNRKSDIDNLLIEAGETQLSNPALINVEILNYLLKFKSSLRMRAIAESIAKQDGVVDILDTYVRSGKYPAKLIGFVTPSMPSVFEYVFSSKAIKNGLRWDMVNQAISSLNVNQEYSFNESTRQKMASNISTFRAVQSKDSKEIASLIYLLELTGIKLANITKFSRDVKEAAANAQAFEVNEQNLKAILGADADLSLDSIKKADVKIYEYILGHLELYVRMLESGGVEYSIKDKSQAPSVLTDISKADREVVERITEFVDVSNVFVDSVIEIPKRIWAIAFDNFLIDTGLSNALAYHMEFSSKENNIIDKSLGEYLELIKGGLAIDKDSLSEYDQDNLKSFIISCLNSDYLSKETKAVLVRDCFEGSLDAALIKFDATSPIEELLRSSTIEDNVQTFNLIKVSPWLTIEEYIENSDGFIDYLEGIEFDSRLFENIASSEKVPAVIKAYIIKHLENFEHILTRASADSILEFAISGKWNLTVPHQLSLYKMTTRQEYRTKLFGQSQKNNTTIAGIETLIQTMSEPYLRLARKGASPKFDDNEDNRSFVNILESLGMVSRIVPDDKTKTIRVYMKRKW